jgi:hypothetical protein
MRAILRIFRQQVLSFFKRLMLAMCAAIGEQCVRIGRLLTPTAGKLTTTLNN